MDKRNILAKQLHYAYFRKNEGVSGVSDDYALSTVTGSLEAAL